MVTIKLYHRASGKDKTAGYIWVSFYLKHESKVNFSTKITCLTKHWNLKNQRISAADKEAPDKNLIIEKILARINDVFVKYRLRNKAISHKTGRHTFATFYLDKTKDLNSLRDILGHSDIRETLMYAHVLERSKQKSINCFDIYKEPVKEIGIKLDFDYWMMN